MTTPKTNPKYTPIPDPNSVHRCASRLVVEYRSEARALAYAERAAMQYEHSDLVTGDEQRAFWLAVVAWIKKAIFEERST